MSGLPDRVRRFLEDTAGARSLDRLELDVKAWGSIDDDVPEAWIARTRLEARKLHDEFVGNEFAGESTP